MEIAFCCTRAGQSEFIRRHFELTVTSLKHQGLVSDQYTRYIENGMDWTHETDPRLSRASIILILVSPDLIDSGYCNGIEMQSLFEKHTLGDILIIPILIRPATWENTLLGKLSVLPPNKIPLTEWHHGLDEPFYMIAWGIHKAVTAFQTPKRYKDRGYAFFEAKRFDEALAAYEQAIQLDPNDGDAYIGKSLSLFYLSRQKEALDAYEKALSLHSNKASTSLVELSNKQRRRRKTIKILFLAANPKDTSSLRLDEEMREIDAVLRRAQFRECFDIKQQWAVRLADLQGHLLRYKPDVVHFSGHGSASNQILLEDNYGNSHPVSSRALSQLFSTLKDNIRCVVLNACYSEQQAQAIAQHIDCVIGMSNAIGDTAAINFSAAFYQALGYGRDVKTAFDLGCIQIDLGNLDERDAPKLLATNVDPSNIIFIKS